MSAPIYNVRDGVIPAIVPSAPITEAHREAAVAIFAIAMKSSHHGAPFREPCAQLIADSEARAVAQWSGGLDQSLPDLYEAAKAERDRLRADCDYNHECINRLAGATGTLGENSEKIVDIALATIDRLGTEAELLKYKVTDWELAFQEQYARAERAEAELATWHLLRLWGTTPEIVHEFIKGQQARIHAAQDIEAELAAEQARVDWLEKRGPWESWNGFGETGITLRENIRDAIDAAMKGGAK